MPKELIAQASIDINVPVAKVWKALIKPEILKQYMFGADVVSEWKEGSTMLWKGEMDGKKYEDKGVILKMLPERMLQYTHFSSLSKLPDVPENYHTLTYELKSEDNHTLISLSQDNNSNGEEKEHSEKMWVALLTALKKLLESSPKNQERKE